MLSQFRHGVRLGYGLQQRRDALPVVAETKTHRIAEMGDVTSDGNPFVDELRALVEAAHQTCPYSKAIRGNIEVAITLV